MGERHPHHGHVLRREGGGEEWATGTLTMDTCWPVVRSWSRILPSLPVARTTRIGSHNTSGYHNTNWAVTPGHHTIPNVYHTTTVGVRLT